MRLGWPGRSPVGAAFGLGAVMATGQAPLDFWWLTLPALLALTALVCRQPDWRSAGWVGWFGGAGYFALAMSWITQPFLIDIATYGWMSPFALVLMAFGLALFWAGAGALAGLVRTRRRPIAFAAALALAEFARGHVLTGLPWALIGHVWITSWPGQTAALLGSLGLTLMTTVAAALPLWRPVAGSVAATLLLGGAAAFGFLRLAEPDPVSTGVQVRLIQPNATQESKWDPEKAIAHFQQMLDYTVEGPVPDLVIWPETAVPFLLDQNPEVTGVIADAARGATVAFGIQRTDGPVAFNSLVFAREDGQPFAIYDKHHLVPFGEYIPYGNFFYDNFGISAFAARLGNGYSPGPGPQVVDLGPRLGKVLPLICYEAVFPQDLVVAERPGWLLQVTNDAWFGHLSGPQQHFAQGRLRAIEQGLPMVRVANTGISGIIDAKGRVVATIPLDTAGWKDVVLPGALAPTPYVRQGDWPALLLLFGVALWGFWPRGRALA
ncbi:apolipoprotein N-acyltransferase [Tabrizicola sp. J26]|uniref:apolipoprotein N-acyltransferase n=1 Tax=Alitabrizicola rongguiensis TaxID=2909234 RepID=UPI001F471D02|nr:apolipoprotein N-acyltransferase [Tabrizicola rongguiensis]MCF1708618.1 apolipoprotein N-acyltransferase [Tabrizicola rongguiensis]